MDREDTMARLVSAVNNTDGACNGVETGHEGFRRRREKCIARW